MAVYRCREPFAYTDRDGVPRQVGVGDLMFSSNPDFAGRESLFELVQDTSVGVEDATAEPGALRSVPRRGPGRPRKEPVEF